MHNYKAEFMLMACTIIWGGTFVAIELGLKSASPMLLVAIRFGMAALIFGIFFFPHLLKINRQLLGQAFLLGLAMAASFALQTLGLAYTTVTRSAFITQLLVFFTPVLQWLWLGRRPGWKILPAIVIVLIGMFYLLEPSGAVPLNMGDALTLGCALAFSVYIVLLDQISSDINRVALIFVQCVIIALICGAYSFLFEEFYFNPELSLWLSLLYLAPLGVNLVIYWHTRYQPLSTPARAAVIFSLEPVFAGLGEILFLGKELTGLIALGAGLVLLGVLIAECPTGRLKSKESVSG